MLRQKITRSEPKNNGLYSEDESSQSQLSIDIQQEMDRLEEMLLDSPRIPFTGLTFVDEEKLLDQLDLIRINLPIAFKEAQSIIQHRDQIFAQAEDYGEEIIDQAGKKAGEILNELDIIRQAEREAAILRQRVQEECAAMQEQTMAEIDRMRTAARQELDQIRQAILTECEDIQSGADDYADQVLQNIEGQLGDMLKVIHNGRQKLEQDAFSQRRTLDGMSVNRALPNSSRR